MDSSSQSNGVKTLLGEPKKAIVRLATPMIIAMSVQTIYNLVDVLWVSGLGSDAVAAVGYVLPFFFMMMAISTGIGVGGGSAISRKIGAQEKKDADLIGAHTIVLMLLTATCFAIPLFIFSDKVFTWIGIGQTFEWTVAYARVLFIGTWFIFFSYVTNATLRGEGDARRAQYAMILGAGLNIVLDPLFIYTMELGVAGAAWATVLSLGVTSLILFYWFFIKRDTYVTYTFRGFRFNRAIIVDILRVGLPASLMQISMSVMMFIIVGIVNVVGGDDGVAVYTIGWRVATIAILPLLGMATAVVSVTGAAFGARDYEKLDIAYLYAIKLGLVIEVIIAVATFVFASQITTVFTLAETSAHIADDLELFLRIVCFYYPTVAFGMLSSAMFQGTGKGLYSLLVTLLRTIVLTTLFTMTAAFILNLGLSGIWWGLVGGNVLGSLVAFLWGRLYIKRLRTSR
jgi:putative MATE family efflux protein